jgi:hypothetical protein
MSQPSIQRTPPHYGIVCIATVLALCSAGCFEDGVARPENYNTLKYKPVTITTTPLNSIDVTEGRYGTVRPLSGVHGSPEPVIPGDEDLVSLYWAQNCAPDPGQPNDASCPPDGAHLTMVRVGTDTLCDISADAIFANADADKNNPQNYNFSALDAHMQAVRQVGNSAQTQILWQFGLMPLSGDGCLGIDGLQMGAPISFCGDSDCQGHEDPGSCPADCPPVCTDGACTGGETAESCPGDCADCGDGTCDSETETANSCAADCGLGISGDGVCNGDENAINSPNDCRSEDRHWPELARNILSHLNEGNGWDPNGRKFDVRYVEFMDDPHERLGYSEGAVPDILFDRYREFAAALKLRWPDNVNPDDPSDVDPQIHVGGISYTLHSVDDLTYETDVQKHPLLKFIDFIAAENSASCPADCAARCGDDACNGGETPGTCATDCAADCGDELCSENENPLTCPADCGSDCGDDICATTETASSPLAPGFCYGDCGPACGNGICGVPLDFLSFRVHAPHPHDVACIAAGLRGYLDDHGLDETELILTNVTPDLDSSDYDDVSLLRDPTLQSDATELFRSTHLGAFLAATRIYLQTPLRNTCQFADAARSAEWMIAGRVPRVFTDLKSHAGEDLVPLQDDILESPFVDADGTAKPAFMSLFPFRQVARDYEAVQVGVLDAATGDWGQGNGTKGFAVLASQRDNASDKLSVIIANANIQDGNADITYEISLEGFGLDLPDFGFVEYKLAVLDRGAVGRESFQFTDTGILETNADKLTFVHQMAVPSVHYIEFVQPTPCSAALEVPLDDDGGCPSNYAKNTTSSMCICDTSGKRCSPDCSKGDYCSSDSGGWCQ